MTGDLASSREHIVRGMECGYVCSDSRLKPNGFAMAFKRYTPLLVPYRHIYITNRTSSSAKPRKGPPTSYTPMIHPLSILPSPPPIISKATQTPPCHRSLSPTFPRSQKHHPPLSPSQRRHQEPHAPLPYQGSHSHACGEWYMLGKREGVMRSVGTRPFGLCMGTWSLGGKQWRSRAVGWWRVCVRGGVGGGK